MKTQERYLESPICPFDEGMGIGYIRFENHKPGAKYYWATTVDGHKFYSFEVKGWK
jgi:hypothetical protein